MKVYVTRIFEFHAAHHLPGHPTCGSIHGHSYKLEVEVSSEIGEAKNYEQAMVLDFKELDKLVKEQVIKYVDHTDLNLRWKIPTAELMAISFWNEISLQMDYRAGEGEYTHNDVRLERIRLWETSNSYAEVRRD